MASSQSSRKPRATGSALKEIAASTISTESILELIDKLGVKDMVVRNLRSRLEDIDLDEVIDDAIAYVRRHPEVLVAGMAAVTVATGLVVFLEARRTEPLAEFIDDDEEEEAETTSRTTGSRSSGSKRASGGGGSRRSS